MIAHHQVGFRVIAPVVGDVQDPDRRHARLAGTRDPYLRKRVPRERVLTHWAAGADRAALKQAIEAFRAGLAALELDAPNGKITLDGNRQAIGTNFVTEVVKGEDGNLVNQLVKIVPNVNQTLGMDPAVFKGIGVPGREVPACKASY